LKSLAAFISTLTILCLLVDVVELNHEVKRLTSDLAAKPSGLVLPISRAEECVAWMYDTNFAKAKQRLCATPPKIKAAPQPDN
jgi:hypothetical protein